MHQRYKITLTSGSIFIKHKVDHHPHPRRRFYTPMSITSKDYHLLSPSQQDMVKIGSLFPIRPKEFSLILKSLNTTVKFRTRI